MSMSTEERHKRLVEQTDEEIDFSELPEIDETWLKTARRVTLPSPEDQKRISLRVDKDVLDFFRRQGRGYQARINAVLRAFVTAHQGEEQSPNRASGGGSGG